eukprot:5438693-Lingulodinium_polyedra.AAC.1
MAGRGEPRPGDAEALEFEVEHAAEGIDRLRRACIDAKPRARLNFAPAALIDGLMLGILFRDRSQTNAVVQLATK